MTRFAVDCDTLLRKRRARSRSAGRRLVAATLIRSQPLEALYQAARLDGVSTGEALERLRRINPLKVRFLGDRVMQARAWKIADQLGWETTYRSRTRRPDQYGRTRSSPRAARSRERFRI